MDNTINNLIELYAVDQTLIKIKEDSIKAKEATIERLKKQISKLEKKNHWIKVIVEPIAQELSRILDLPVWEILGPFGICCETSIHLSKDEETHKQCKLRKSITFVPLFNYQENDYKIGVRDYSVNTGKFPQGSLGDVNGMNHPVTDISNMPITELAEKWVH